MSTIPTHVYGFYLPICLSALPIWARKKSQKNREGNRIRHLKKTVLNCSNACAYATEPKKSHKSQPEEVFLLEARMGGVWSVCSPRG